MTELIACLSTGKGTWGHVSRLLEDQSWDKIFLIANEYASENFKSNNKIEIITINENIGIKDLRDAIKSALKEKIKGTEVGVNFISGSGKEHMALISALIQLGIGIRFIALTKDGIEEI